MQRDARALLAGRGFLANHGGFQRARAFGREFVGLGVLRPLVGDDAHHLRDHVAGALDHDCVADPDVLALDLVLIVQGDVLHDHAADADRLELADRRERAGAADLDLDVAQHGGRLLGGEFMRDRPARRARHEAEPLLPVEPVDLVDDAVDVVVELGALLLDLLMEGEQLFDALAVAGSADWS